MGSPLWGRTGGRRERGQQFWSVATKRCPLSRRPWAGGGIAAYTMRIWYWGAPFGGGREGGGRGGSSLERSDNVLPPLPTTVGGRGDCCLQCFGSDKCSPLGGRRERAMRARGQIMCACRRNRSPLRPSREHGVFAAYTKAQKKR